MSQTLSDGLLRVLSLYLHCTSIHSISLFSLSLLTIAKAKVLIFKEEGNQKTRPPSSLLSLLSTLSLTLSKSLSLWFFSCSTFEVSIHLTHSLSSLSLACRRTLYQLPQHTIAVSAVSLALFDVLVAWERSTAMSLANERIGKVIRNRAKEQRGSRKRCLIQLVLKLL